MDNTDQIPSRFNNFFASRENDFDSLWREFNGSNSIISDARDIALNQPRTKCVVYENSKHLQCHDEENENLHICRIDFQRWDSWADLYVQQILLNETRDTLHVFDGRIFEQLTDPRFVLMNIRNACKELDGPVYIVTSKMGNGHYRSWSEENFIKLLISVGLNSVVLQENSAILMVSHDEEFMRNCISRYNIPRNIFEARVLLLVTEDADVEISGGIGTYAVSYTHLTLPTILLV